MIPHLTTMKLFFLLPLLSGEGWGEFVFPATEWRPICRNH